MSEPVRVTVIEGRTVLVTEMTPPIPGSLELLLSGGRDVRGLRWQPLRVAFRDPLRLAGARAECLQDEHRLRRWLEGFHSGNDGATRYLCLMACADCGAVCVRDRSFDSLDGLRVGRRPLRRRDHIIGWYSGARPRGRVYS
jgi:hypothetical protein